MVQTWTRSAWVRAYDAALLEPEMQKVAIRVKAAQIAIDSRLQELSGGHHSCDAREVQALYHAIDALRVSQALRRRTSRGIGPDGQQDSGAECYTKDHGS
jgi:hypothetical protein